MNLFLLNLGLALLWVFLGGRPSFGSFLVGFALGFGLLALLRPLYPDSGYVRRITALGRFAMIQLRDLAVSNLSMARSVLLRSRRSLRPDLLAYDLSELRPNEALLLAHLVTLTPGTAAVEVDPQLRSLTLHVFDAADPDSVRAAIDRNLKRPMLAFTR